MRKTPLHDWAEEQGAVFVETGLWMRSSWFPQGGEDWLASGLREVLATRERVGLCDVSTLGKIDVQGQDAAEFLNRLYCNTFSTLDVGKARYGLMLREDGIVFDDGTTSRLAPDHFLMTTTTANAARVMIAYGILPSGALARARRAVCFGDGAMGADGGCRAKGAGHLAEDR